MNSLVAKALRSSPKIDSKTRIKAAFASAVTGRKSPLLSKSEEARIALDNLKNKPIGGVGYSLQQKTASGFFQSRLAFAKNPINLFLQNLGRQIAGFGADVKVGVGAVDIFDTAMKEGLL